MATVNLLSPEQVQKLYVHQIEQTIAAYDPAHIVVGEALQNALDAVILSDNGTHKIRVELNFDLNQITVLDDGVGFPNDPNLLMLGGTTKSDARGLGGQVGVGMKVILFSSQSFRIRSNGDHGPISFEIAEGSYYGRTPSPNLSVPNPLPIDPEPIVGGGTELTYTLPPSSESSLVDDFVREVLERTIPDGDSDAFLQTLQDATGETFPNRFAGIMACFLRRFTYAGNVQYSLGGKPELAGTTITISVTCSDPVGRFGSFIGGFFDGQSGFEFDIEPGYLLVEESLSWAKNPKPAMYEERLGRGGDNLQRTARGFNRVLLTSPEEFESLLVNKQGNIGKEATALISRFQKYLFPKINSINVVIGRIPQFLRYSPGGSRRVISCNGVITDHGFDITAGRNQQYVRCIDLVIDLDAQLNYGKRHITDGHLVGLARSFVNEAYRATLQNGAGKWVGRIVPGDEREDRDKFFARADLGVEILTSQKLPSDENDVIGLFFELAGRGEISGYKIFGLSQSDQYDSRGLIETEGSTLAEQLAAARDERDLKVIEFKLHASSIYREFDSREKDCSEIDMVIAWDEGSATDNQFVTEEIQFSRAYEQTPSRVFPGVQRYIQDTRTDEQVQLLLLKPIVEQLSHGSSE